MCTFSGLSLADEVFTGVSERRAVIENLLSGCVLDEPAVKRMEGN